MKTIAIIFVLAASCARADWKDLKEGLDPTTAEHCVGAPLFGNRSRGGTFVTWTYDNGGFIFFENGRVHFWQPPADKTGGTQALASAASPTTIVAHAEKSVESAASGKPASPNGMTLRW